MSSNTKTIAVIVVIIIVVAGVAGIVLLGPLLFPTGPRVAIVFATGGLGDKSFNDAAYDGAVMARTDFGWNFTYAEPTQISEYEGFLRDFSEAGVYDLIISIGFDQADALNETAAEFPNQKYAIVDMVVDQPNVASLVFDEHEGSALVGAIAGLTTVSDKVGFIGGLDIPLINKFAAGYVWGADHVNDGVNYTIAYTNDWVDTTAGQNLADAMYTAGTDVIFAAAGRSGLGVFTSAKNNNDTTGFPNPLWAIGVDSPQMYLGCANTNDPEPPTVGLTSMLKRVDIAVYSTIQKVMLGTFAAGINVFNLANNGLGYEVNEELLTLPSSVITAVEELKAGIIAGTYTVPSNLTALVDAITY
ncbi:MAG: BMP family ABC transporter substrate-binding protein [Candidatus Thorarchaeota archaeon]|nr:BMP family ABC transporter substrate-binding protein [Candidatus Thorarchaeota archaeon]